MWDGIGKIKMIFSKMNYKPVKPKNGTLCQKPEFV